MSVPKVDLLFTQDKRSWPATMYCRQFQLRRKMIRQCQTSSTSCSLSLSYLIFLSHTHTHPISLSIFLSLTHTPTLSLSECLFNLFQCNNYALYMFVVSCDKRLSLSATSSLFLSLSLCPTLHNLRLFIIRYITQDTFTLTITTM